MQFVANGPDIPEALLQAHEEGQVVFFCGAGISYPAGLPGFNGLVGKVYKCIGTQPLPNEKAAFDRGQYDATLDLLERRVPGRRIAVRRAVAEVLRPNLRKKGATDTHAALLGLGRCRDGALRLVTTNFDLIFERAARRTKQQFTAYRAPMLPIPKKSRWDGLVYLHGQLPAVSDDVALQRLVITSGDFGLAYLTERWASRFVSELFKNFTVVFVGYSINDPVLRYMMDALAADRMLGEETPQAYALGDCVPGDEESRTNEWRAKGVVPILYGVPASSDDHSALHATLQKWSETYRDGVLGKERLVVENALARPSASTLQDNFVGRMMWALADESGLPAKRFADLNPLPAIDWLDAFSDDRYSIVDLSRFGVHPRPSDREPLKFSLVHRPSPYRRAPWMELTAWTIQSGQWDDVMVHLARWLVRHLNSAKLILWIAKRGGRIHKQWNWMIARELERSAGSGSASQQESQGERDSLDTSPGPVVRKLWHLILSGRVKSAVEHHDAYAWKDRFLSQGPSATVRLDLREILAPKVSLREPFRYDEKTRNIEEPVQIRDLVEWELDLATPHVSTVIEAAFEGERRLLLAAFLDDFQLLLRDAMDLMRDLGDADESNDRSSWHLPSISDHPQNQRFHDWVLLIELVRDAWLAAKEVDADRALLVALQWFRTPYPLYKRLALFAAAHHDGVDSSRWVSWLTADNARWLWATETSRETLRLLATRGPELSAIERELLEAAIIQGPPRSMYIDDIEPDAWLDIRNRATWLRLAKLQVAGGALGRAAADIVATLSASNPLWRIAADQRDEFSVWMGSIDDDESSGATPVEVTSKKRNELVAWLKQPQPDSWKYSRDEWEDICRKWFYRSLSALRVLARDGNWPVDRWRTALQVWREDGRAKRSWTFAAPVIQEVPESVLREIVSSVTSWMMAATSESDQHEGIMIELMRRIMGLNLQADTGIQVNGAPIDQPVMEALNHPIGQVAQALVSLLFKRKPNDNDHLPPDLAQLFIELCEVRAAEFRHGRVILSANLIALFRVDRAWSGTHLLPLLSWAAPSEARASWAGFLWSPRLYRPLLVAFKADLLATAEHYDDLGEHKRQYAPYLTYVALNRPDEYSWADLEVAFRNLPGYALADSARALVQALEGAGDRRDEYWRNRVKPFWQSAWPKSLDLISAPIAEQLARLCVAAIDEFPDVVAAVEDWLVPLEHPHYLLGLLDESGLCARFPDAALQLLRKIVDDQSQIHGSLTECIEEVSQAKPALRGSPEFRRLEEIARRRQR